MKIFYFRNVFKELHSLKNKVSIVSISRILSSSVAYKAFLLLLYNILCHAHPTVLVLQLILQHTYDHMLSFIPHNAQQFIDWVVRLGQVQVFENSFLYLFTYLFFICLFVFTFS